MRGEICPLFIDGPLKGGTYPVTSLHNGVTVPANTWWDVAEERIRRDSPAKDDTHYFVHLFPISPGRNIAICSVHRDQRKLNWHEVVGQLLSDKAKQAMVR